MLGKGAEANQVDSQDGAFPLPMAAQAGHGASVQAFLDKSAEATLVRPHEISPLPMAAQQGHEACLQALLDKGADANHVNLQDGAVLLCSWLCCRAC